MSTRDSLAPSAKEQAELLDASITCVALFRERGSVTSKRATEAQEHTITLVVVWPAILIETRKESWWAAWPMLLSNPRMAWLLCAPVHAVPSR